LSKSVAIGSDFSVTLQTGYAMTRTEPNPSAPVESSNFYVPPPPAPPATSATSPAAAAAAPPGAAQTYSTDRSAKLNILPTGTSFSAGAAMSSADDKWLRGFSAEQKLLGPLSVTGSVSETTTGELNKSFTARFKRSW
jgi:hypothetical protein